MVGNDAAPKADGPRGLIWKIDRFALHDGPGIRTSVYFQGCPLSCRWCSNPEGQSTEPQLMFLDSRCDGCGLCFGSCSRGALSDGGGPSAECRPGFDRRPLIRRPLCDACGDCAAACPSAALSVPARLYTIDELVEGFERDRAAFKRSGGGVTCTGGEPLRQAPFLTALLSECRRRGLHTVVETCGYVGETSLVAVLPHVDWLFFDLKHPCAAEHARLTGRDNAPILRNLRRASELLGELGHTLVLRYVVVPELNAGAAIADLAELAASLPHLDQVELLPFHNYGSYKYTAIGRSYDLEGHRSPSAEEMQGHRGTIEEAGLRCTIGNA